jgi:hypothetical protein
MHAPGHPQFPPPINAVCTGQAAWAHKASLRLGPNTAGRPQLFQFRKVHAALQMMAAHERRNGMRFEIALRLRPDLCLASAATFFSYAIERARLYPVAFFSADGVAVLPRWMADAYGNFWRSHGADCTLPASWSGGAGAACDVLHARRARPSNGSPTHFFFLGATIWLLPQAAKSVCKLPAPTELAHDEPVSSTDSSPLRRRRGVGRHRSAPLLAPPRQRHARGDHAAAPLPIRLHAVELALLTPPSGRK